MYQPKLFRYLDKFSKQDWRLFGRYLRGVFREGHDALILFDILVSSKKKLDQGDFNVLDLQKKDFKNTSKKQIQNLMSVLSRQVEDYWVWSDLQEQDLRMDMLKVESLNRRNLYEQSEKYYHKVMGDKETLNPWVGYYKARSAFTLLFSNHTSKSKVTWMDSLFNNTSRELVKWYENISMWILAESYNLRQLNRHSEFADVQILEDSLSFSNYKDDLSLVSQEQLRLVKNGHAEEPEFISKLLFEGRFTDPLVRLVFYYRVREYWIRKARTGDNVAVQKLVELIQWSTSNHVLIVNDVVSRGQYVSDLNVLCALGTSKNVEEFIGKYINRIPFGARADVRIISEMLYSYAFQKYENVIEIFSIKKCNSLSLNIQATGLFLRASYEIYGSDMNYFHYYLINAGLLVRRNRGKLSKRKATAMINFLKVFSLIINRKEKEKIASFVQGCDHLLYRPWILEKLDFYNY